MTRSQAIDIFSFATPSDLGIRNIARTHHAEDDVTTWTADVFDPTLPAGDDVIGHAVFVEHYPLVGITWL
jgi:hypothetical protein